MIKRLTAWLLLCPAVAVAGEPLSLWQLEGESNRVYLLGSIHLLRRDDHPLPERIDAAYADAERLVMELDMDDLDPVASQMLFREYGLLSDGETLESVLGEARYARALNAARSMQVPLHLFAEAEPWYAAITIEQLALTRLGFNAGLGIEATFTDRARRDGKPITGLETVAEQLGFLDNLDREAQADMLMQTLDETLGVESMMDALIAAWRRGDTTWFEQHVLGDMRSAEALYDAIVVQRNTRWVEQIIELLDDTDDYLVIVGTLHLVGSDGLPELLESRGYDVRQLRQEN